MRRILLPLLLLLAVSAARAVNYQAAVSQGAELKDASQVELTGEAPLSRLEKLEIDPKWGYVSFWFRPGFDSDDGKRHGILLLGSPKSGLYVEKSAHNLLRLVSVAGGRTSASRKAVAFKAGEWHHIAFAWFTNDDGVPCGLPLYFDRECVAGEIPCKDAYFDQDQIPGSITLDGRSGEFRDIVVRNGRWGSQRRLDNSALVRQVYGDFFRSLPAEEIRITPRPWRIQCDERIVRGHAKTFGLEAKLNGAWLMVTDEVSAYGNWSEFDAKPFISWSTDSASLARPVADPKKAQIEGLSEGNVTVQAEYRGRQAAFSTEVISPDQPDLTVQFVEQLPRYSFKAEKVKSAPGDAITSIVHVANYGPVPSPGGERLLFQVGGPDRLVCRQERTLPSLAPQEIRTYTNCWIWPAEPVPVAAEVFPEEDLCLVNNRVCDLNTARPLWFAFSPMVATNYFKARRLNCLGSHSMFDWVSAHKYRLDLLLRETRYPDICPDGLQETYRIDNLVYNYYEKKQDNPYFQLEEYRDGGFPITDNPDDHASHQSSDRFFESLNASVIHELGHTCLALPDVYGYPVRRQNVFLADPEGRPYVGTRYMPCFDDNIFSSTAENLPCGTAYSSLMVGCHMWINRANAGKIAYCSGYRGPRFWGVQGRFIPISENILKIYGVDDELLPDAAVYIYHVSHAKINSFADKYFSDCPKYRGFTSSEGCYPIPDSTDADWDCGSTDAFDGSYYPWNPFGIPTDEPGYIRDTAGTPSVWRVDGLLLVKIETADDVEFHLLPLTEFNEQFFCGDKFRGVYEIRTQLHRTPRPALRKTVVPEACRKENKVPVVRLNATSFKARPGSTVTVDASQSYDPEGQPLRYYWHDANNWYATDFREGPVQQYKVPDKPGQQIKKAVYVLDGIRGSALTEFTIEAE